MSIQVAIEDLSAVAGEYGTAPYVLVNAETGPPWVNHTSVSWVEGEAEVSVGRRAAAALAANPSACLLWPATRDQTMSLIVDAEADPASVGADGGLVRLRPTAAVRHRPA